MPPNQPSRSTARAVTKEKHVKLTRLTKWNESQNGHCPAIYSAANGDLVVQGWVLDQDTRGNLQDRAANEDGVRIPRSLIDDFMKGE
jgi:hypothetical protein